MHDYLFSVMIPQYFEVNCYDRNKVVLLGGRNFLSPKRFHLQYERPYTFQNCRDEIAISLSIFLIGTWYF